MNAQTTFPVSQAGQAAPVPMMRKLGLAGLFFVCSFVIFILGSNYFEIFPTNQNLTFNLALSGVCLATALGLRASARTRGYWRVAFAFFLASLAAPITLALVNWRDDLMISLGLTVLDSKGVAIGKLIEVGLVVVPLLVLTRLSGDRLGSLYLQRGILKTNLLVGGLVMINFSASAFLFFAVRFTSSDRLAAALLWGLVFSFANAFMEELWLRGLFLKRFVPLIGPTGAIWVTSVIFALMHGGATYLTPIAVPFIVANTLTLGLACSYLMLKTDSIWGAVLLHAASDLFLFIALLSNA